MSVLTQSRPEMVEAMATGGRDRPMLGRAVIVASPTQLGALRRRLLRIFDEIREEFEDPGEDVNAADAAEVERWALTLTFAPVDR